MSSDEDLDYVKAFNQTFGSVERAQARLADERRAGRTKKQRKPSVAKKQMNVRASDQTHALINRLAEKARCDKTAIFERAILELAQREGLV